MVCFGPILRSANTTRKFSAGVFIAGLRLNPSVAKARADLDQFANAGTGSAVTDLIFSMAKREVTFFSGTVAISFL
jgi:hypothetical protein